MRRTRICIALACLGFSLGCGSGVEGAAGAAGPADGSASVAEQDTAVPTDAPVVTEILAAMEDPPGAPGRRLTLVRYTIAPGAELAPHVHPGVQMASVQSGTLAYEIISGEVTIHRAGGRGSPALAERLSGPTRTTLGPGDAVVEVGDMQHFGANRGTAPVIILAALVTEDGRDLAIPIETVFSQ